MIHVYCTVFPIAETDKRSLLLNLRYVTEDSFGSAYGQDGEAERLRFSELGSSREVDELD